MPIGVLLSLDTPLDSEQPEFLFTCRKCRKRLFLSSQLIPHSVGEGETAFKWHRREIGSAEPVRVPSATSRFEHVSILDLVCLQACTSLFLNRMEWMGEMGANQGKLHCPKCNAKIGSKPNNRAVLLWSLMKCLLAFCWAGAQCSCGEWVTPALQVVASKVDANKLKQTSV